MVEKILDCEFLSGLLQSQRGRCALTALPMSELNGPMAITINCKDPAKGYTPGNVQLVCQWVNRAKHAMSNDEFKRILVLCRKEAPFIDAESYDIVYNEMVGRRKSLAAMGRLAVPITASQGCMDQFYTCFLRVLYEWLVEECWARALEVRLHQDYLTIEFETGRWIRLGILSKPETPAGVFGMECAEPDHEDDNSRVVVWWYQVEIADPGSIEFVQGKVRRELAWLDDQG